MKICYFGIFDENYNRNKVIIQGLRENGVEIIYCQSDKKGIAKYFDLSQKHQRIKNDYEAMIVGFPGWTMMILARLLKTDQAEELAEKIEKVKSWGGERLKEKGEKLKAKVEEKYNLKNLVEKILYNI